MSLSQYMTHNYRRKLQKLIERTTTDNYSQHREDTMKRWTKQVEFWETYKPQQ